MLGNCSTSCEWQKWIEFSSWNLFHIIMWITFSDQGRLDVEVQLPNKGVQRSGEQSQSLGQPNCPTLITIVRFQKEAPSLMSLKKPSDNYSLLLIGGNSHCCPEQIFVRIFPEHVGVKFAGWIVAHHYNTYSKEWIY